MVVEDPMGASERVSSIVKGSEMLVRIACVVRWIAILLRWTWWFRAHVCTLDTEEVGVSESRESILRG